MVLTKWRKTAAPLWGRLVNSVRKNIVFLAGKIRIQKLKPIKVQACVRGVGRRQSDTHPAGGGLVQDLAAMTAADEPEGWEVISMVNHVYIVEIVSIPNDWAPTDSADPFAPSIKTHTKIPFDCPIMAEDYRRQWNESEMKNPKQLWALARVISRRRIRKRRRATSAQQNAGNRPVYGTVA